MELTKKEKENLKENLIRAKNYLITLDDPGVGLCHCIHKNNFTWAEETDYKMDWFKTQKPSEILHPEFFIHPTFSGGVWWWMVNPESENQRILFLDKLIKQL